MWFFWRSIFAVVKSQIDRRNEWGIPTLVGARVAFRVRHFTAGTECGDRLMSFMFRRSVKPVG